VKNEYIKYQIALPYCVIKKQYRICSIGYRVTKLNIRGIILFSIFVVPCITNLFYYK